MAVVNVSLNNMINVKDSRWLQLEVCREFQRSKCSRSDTECKFAHPPPNVEVQNGRVIACYDSIKGRCNREKPPCKYFHPPQHLKDQLLINGRNHLALKNALMLQMGMSPGQAVLPGQIPTIASPYLAGVPQLGGAYNPYVSASPMLQVVTSDATGVTSQLGVVSAAGYPAPGAKMQRSDRIEVCREFQRGTCRRAESECRYAHPPEGVGIEMCPPPLVGEGEGGIGTASLATPSAATVAAVAGTAAADPVPMVTVCMDAVRGRCTREPCRYFHPPAHLLPTVHANQQRARNALPSAASATAAAAASATTAAAAAYALPQASGYADAGRKRTRDPTEELVMAYPGMVQYKRSAADKTAMMYQPTAGASAAAAAAAYQQAHALMQLQQPFVPVSCEYSGAAISAASSTTSSSASIASSSSTATNSSASSSSFPYASASISSSSVSYSNAKTVSYNANPSVVLTNGSATAAFEVVNSATRSDENTTTAESNRKDSENATDDSLPGPSAVSNVSSALKRPHSTTPTSSSAIAYSSAPIPTLYSTTPTSMYMPGSIANQSALAYTGVSLNKHVASAAAAATNTQASATHPSVAAMQQYVNPYALLSAQTQMNPYAGALAGNPLLGGFPGVAGFQAVTPGQANAAAAQQHLAALQFNNSYAGLAGLYATPGALSLGGMASLATPSVLPPYVGLGVPSAAAAAAAAAAAMGGMNPIRGVPTAVPNVGAVAHPAAAVAALTNSAGLQPYKKMRTM